MAGHTAILPTMQTDKAALDELGDDERLVLTRVVRRMWEAVGDDYVHDVTNVVANIDPHWCEKHPDEGRLLPESECRFTSRSDQPVSLGWHAIEHAAPQEDHGEEDEAVGNIIPANLTDGVSIAPVPQGGATLSEGKTKPPKPFTEATLLAAMEHASRWVEDKDLKAALDDDESHSGGIGTPATRADVIEKLIRTGYVERKGKQLRSTEQGRSLIDVVAPKLKDVALTADMERRLSEVEHGQAAASQVETEFRDLAARIPADAQTAIVRTTCRRKHGTRNRSETAHAAASPSSKRARCSNAPPTGERNNPTAHGRPRRDAAGAPGRPSPARPSPTRPCAGCSTAGRSASRASPRGRAARLTPRSSSTRTRASPSTSAITTRKGKRNDEFNLGSFVWGAVFLVAGLSFLSSSALVGILFLLLAAANLANAMSAQLDFVNQAGGRNSVKVSILEKDKLMQLAQNIQRLVFADVEGQRHQESMDMAQKQYAAQTNSVLIQQQMLDQQRKATADDNPSIPTE